METHFNHRLSRTRKAIIQSLSIHGLRYRATKLNNLKSGSPFFNRVIQGMFICARRKKCVPKITVSYHEATVVKMLQLATDLDDLGRDMVKTICAVNGKEIKVYVQHPVDNSFIGVGYKFMLPLKDDK